MRWTLFLICSIGTCSLPGGCVSREEVATKSHSSGAEDETEPRRENVAIGSDKREAFVFRGKYYKTTGPCIDLGAGRLGMPFIDAFEVVEVLEGDLKAKHVVVRAMTEGGSRYPTGLAEGETRTLRLVPSAETSRLLREKGKEGITFLWIDGDEIEEQEVAK
jgi:hypothetical protein